jgi:hypothetical protein
MAAKVAKALAAQRALPRQIASDVAARGIAGSRRGAKEEGLASDVVRGGTYIYASLLSLYIYIYV